MAEVLIQLAVTDLAIIDTDLTIITIELDIFDITVDVKHRSISTPLCVTFLGRVVTPSTPGAGRP